jgi:hypothetical protein
MTAALIGDGPCLTQPRSRGSLKPERQTMSRHTLTNSDLCQFTGTEYWYRHSLNRDVVYTEGVQYVADKGGAYWLIDAIAIAQRSEKTVSAEVFQVWTLKVREDRSASLVCDDGNDNIVYAQHIPFTDFPLDEIKLYFTDNTLLLPSEY